MITRVLFFKVILVKAVLFTNPFVFIESSTGSSSSGTCDDGIQNQNEKGVDCGGPCPYCQGLLPINDFEINNFPISAISKNHQG